MTTFAPQLAWSAVLLGASLIPSGGPAAQQAAAWDDYRVIQFAVVDGLAPQQVLGMDDNGTIALAARDGTTRSVLVDELGTTSSQLALLRAFRLVETHGDSVRTRFAILDSATTERLRSETSEAARRLAPRLVPAVSAARRLLAASGREENLFSIMFSLGLDGLPWEIWEQRGLLPPRTLTAEEPFWSGAIWAVNPARRFDVGTNSISEDGLSLKVTWSYSTVRHLGPFVSNWPAVGALVSDLQQGRVLRSQLVSGTFADYGLWRSDGQFTIPEITAVPSDSLYGALLEAAHVIADAAPELIAGTESLLALGVPESEALVIGYHELMWDLVDALVAQGTLTLPRVLTDPEHATRRDAAALLFVVRDGT
jgi:hypothetical protein